MSTQLGANESSILLFQLNDYTKSKLLPLPIEYGFVVQVQIEKFVLC
jgi:hypothetical protein